MQRKLGLKKEKGNKNIMNKVVDPGSGDVIM